MNICVGVDSPVSLYADDTVGRGFETGDGRGGVLAFSEEEEDMFSSTAHINIAYHQSKSPKVRDPRRCYSSESRTQ